MSRFSFLICQRDTARSWAVSVSQWFYAGLAIALVGTASLAPAADFETQVAPIFVRRCLECHQGSEASGKLNLNSAPALMAGGESGTAVVARQPDASLLWQRVRDGEMPPPKQGKKQTLPAEEIETLRRWIANGANWPAGRQLDLFEATNDKRAGRDWWSLQPIRDPAVPGNVRQPAEIRTPVDAFLAAQLDQKNWQFAPVADARTLVRRLYFDLTGLPPTFAEVQAFHDDDAPDKYERLVDRLLASPRMGERWGRYWLDVVRFAETCGYERDQIKPHAWKYRDWVIRACNQDLPFAKFVTEQLAGDEVPERTDDSLIATGFIRLGTWNDEPNDPHEYKYDRLEDMVHTTGSAFLGLTLKCARCHDHKFDPVSQHDYFRVANAFWAGFIEPGPRELLGGPDEKALGVKEIFGWTDRSASPPPLQLLKKGEIKHPGPVVEPGQLSLVPALYRPVAPPPAAAQTTQRRLQLAQWITDRQNPLTARVWVNRLWQNHFGQGLVRSPDNFGFTGEKPTHPELLDYLASELLERHGFASNKTLHRLLVTSHAYRQASIHPQADEYVQTDASNRGWWRAQRRRLDAEAIRDALLATSGRLDVGKANGPSFSPEISAEAAEGLSRKSGAWKASPESEQGRRSVFLFAQRSLLPPLATVFDFPDTTLPCGQRDVTTVAPQALALLNNPFIHQQSQLFARRVLAAMPDAERGAQVVHAWQIAVCRQPTETELRESLRHFETQQRRFAAQSPRTDAGFLAWSSLCHVLLNTNEFLYID